jgi:hypothetical protein
MDKPIVIALNGEHNSGKDTAAEIICDLYKNAQTFAFANTLKHIISELLSVTYEMIEKDKRNHTKIYTIGNETYNMREILINFGEKIKLLGNGVWVKHVSKMLDKDNLNIITDLRYPEELNYLKKHNRVHVVKITSRYTDDLYKFDNLPYDYLIKNTGNLDDFRWEVEDKMSQVLNYYMISDGKAVLRYAT